MTNDAVPVTAGLLPCPFCGGEAILMTPAPNRAGVRCGECSGQTPLLFATEEAIAAWNARHRGSTAVVDVRDTLPERIGRLTLGDQLSSNHYCGGSHEMPDGQPIYWEQRGGEYPDEIEGYCLTCAIDRAESEAGWCECSTSASLASLSQTPATPMVQEGLREALTDPNAVHVNMLRGGIAKPSIAQIIHIYGDDAIRAALSATPAQEGEQ